MVVLGILAVSDERGTPVKGELLKIRDLLADQVPPQPQTRGPEP